MSQTSEQSPPQAVPNRVLHKVQTIGTRCTGIKLHSCWPDDANVATGDPVGIRHRDDGTAEYLLGDYDAADVDEEVRLQSQGRVAVTNAVAFITDLELGDRVWLERTDDTTVVLSSTR